MNDPHLNIFYSYNRDNELIENNLTRAFIVLLKFLSTSNKQKLLSALFHEPIHSSSICLALQGNIDKSVINKSKIRKIVTITDFNAYEELANYEDSQKYERVKLTHLLRPDAWIYDSQEQEFCYLIEAKPPEAFLEAKQYIAYAKKYFNYNYDLLRNNLIHITWYDILHALDLMIPNEQESILISNFIDFLSFAGIKLFYGFSIEILNKSPKLKLLGGFLIPSWDKLLSLPKII